MYQQVNLYQPVFRHEEKVFSALTLLQLLGITALVLFAGFGYLRWQLAQQDTQLRHLQQTHDRLGSEIERLESQQAGAELAPLDDRIAALENQLQQLDRLVAELDEVRPPEAGAVFSRALTGLAQTPAEGLWLTRIELRTGGATRLEGRSWSPQRVPEYLDRLNQQADPALNGLSQIRIAQAEAPAGQVRFTLSNRPMGVDLP